jgi:hypothetical protein
MLEFLITITVETNFLLVSWMLLLLLLYSEVVRVVGRGLCYCQVTL